MATDNMSSLQGGSRSGWCLNLVPIAACTVVASMLAPQVVDPTSHEVPYGLLLGFRCDGRYLISIWLHNRTHQDAIFAAGGPNALQQVVAEEVSKGGGAIATVMRGRERTSESAATSLGVDASATLQNLGKSFLVRSHQHRTVMTS